MKLNKLYHGLGIVISLILIFEVYDINKKSSVPKNEPIFIKEETKVKKGPLKPEDHVVDLMLIKAAILEKPAGSYKQPAPSTKFSNYFTAGEFTKGGTRKFPGWETEAKCRKLARALDILRDYYGGAITINSGYRDAATNKRIGGAPQSQHVYGCAVDVVIRDKKGKVVNHQKVYKEWLDSWIKVGGIGNYGASRAINHFDLREVPATWFWKSVGGKDEKGGKGMVPDWMLDLVEEDHGEE